MDLKPSKNTHELITTLEERGLIINNPMKAMAYLEENGYHHLNIYFHKHMQIVKDETGKKIRVDIFQKGATFEQIINAHENDRWLRHELSCIIEPIEVKLRSILAHHLGMNYGSSAFYEPTAFAQHDRWLDVSERFSLDIDYRTDDPIVQLHNEKYDGKFHIWAVTELISFNLLVKLFSALHNSDKKAIGREFNDSPPQYLEGWLISISDLRNICAHHKFLFRRIYDHFPRMMDQFNWSPQENKKLFAIMLVMKEISSTSRFNTRIHSLIDQDLKKNFLNFYDYGFPENWADRLFT